MGVGAPPVWVPRLRPRGHTRPAGPPAVHLGCSLRGRWAQPAGSWGEMRQPPTRGPANSGGSCAPCLRMCSTGSEGLVPSPVSIIHF